MTSNPEQYLHQWDDPDNPSRCDECGAVYRDSGHHARDNEECPAMLRFELDCAREDLDTIRMTCIEAGVDVKFDSETPTTMLVSILAVLAEDLKQEVWDAESYYHCCED